jgi:hypothetical protein
MQICEIQKNKTVARIYCISSIYYDFIGAGGVVCHGFTRFDVSLVLKPDGMHSNH